MKIIKIGAVWCPGCLVMKKIWNNIIKSYDLDIMELDYDMDSEAVSNYNVGDILPVVIFTNDEGNELERLVGEKKENEIVEIINKYEEV